MAYREENRGEQSYRPRDVNKDEATEISETALMT